MNLLKLTEQYKNYLWNNRKSGLGEAMPDRCM